MSDTQTSHLLSANSERSEPHPLHPPSGRVERSEGRAFPPDSLLISVVMPCLNESRTLAACITEARAGCEAALISRSALAPGSDINRSALAHGSLDYEILIADNGSTDGSQEIAIAHGARVIPVEQKGYGSALLGGIAAAQGKYIVMGDSDSSYDFGDIPKLIEKLEEGNDLVLGNRFAGGIQPGAMPWHHRYIGNPILSGLGRLLYRTPCRDWHCGLRAFDREKINSLQLKSTGMEFASEMVLRASQAKLRMAEVPTTLRPDGRDRPPHLRSVRDGFRHLRLLATNGSRELAKLLTLVAMVLTCICSGWLAFAPFSRVDSENELQATPEYQYVSGLRGERIFKITNIGAKKIAIRAIHTSCMCTVPGEHPKSLEPGQEFMLPVKYDFTTSNGKKEVLVFVNYFCTDNANFYRHLEIGLRSNEY